MKTKVIPRTGIVPNGIVIRPSEVNTGDVVGITGVIGNIVATP